MTTSTPAPTSFSPGKPDESVPRSHVSMGTLRASMTRFPVSRETLEDFRGSNGEKGPEPKDAERESATRSGRDEGVKEVKSGRTGVEERDEEDERAAVTRDKEKEVYHGEEPEQNSRGASHDPGGSWLAKHGLLLKPAYKEQAT
ncbi:hypothetical protein NDU88_008318 [Pleurodeles waltl]|uniref:Uncharacterized protein n=1 Tax=Pleurodeles waltl TaxID=8319 RepID=A0AAV7VVG6_PLEWA|nr:hypothetical protein NDU88_008318 [Pleurodeles waltl]